MENNKVIGFIYPIARQFGFGEPVVEKEVENSHGTMFQTTFKKDSVTVSILSDASGKVLDVARTDTVTGSFTLWGESAESFDQAAAWLAGEVNT